jgi:hypothetical protein
MLAQESSDFIPGKIVSLKAHTDGMAHSRTTRPRTTSTCSGRDVDRQLASKHAMVLKAFIDEPLVEPDELERELL